MGVVCCSRIVVKEDGSERCRKRHGENDNAEKREKGLSWGVSGRGRLWVPACKRSRKTIWRKVRRQIRHKVSRTVGHEDKYVSGVVALAFPPDVRHPQAVFEIVKKTIRKGLSEQPAVVSSLNKRR